MKQSRVLAMGAWAMGFVSMGCPDGGVPAVSAADADAGVEADIDLTNGPGAAAASYAMRGTTLTALLPSAEDGAPAGLYRTVLPPGDSLRAALLALPAQVAGPPLVPDSPVVHFVVRQRGQERALTAGLPSTDPAVANVLTDLERKQAAMRAAPLVTLRLEVVLPPPGPSLVTVRVVAQGAAGAEETIDPGSFVVQAASEPPPPKPGFTPLPPEWTSVSTPPSDARPRRVAAGSHVDVALPVTLPADTPKLAVRAVYDGMVSLAAPGVTRDARFRVSSAAVAVTGGSAGRSDHQPPAEPKPAPTARPSATTSW